jgi:hypothetical protein
VVGRAGGLRGGSRGVLGASVERGAESETRPRVRFAGFSSKSAAGGELRRLLLALVPSLLGPADGGGVEAGGSVLVVDLREGTRPLRRRQDVIDEVGDTCAYAGGQLE